MSGYNPLFDSMFTGTLCGKWPDIGVWSCLIGLKDKNGHIDCTPQYLAGVLGLEVDTLLKCLERFMEPDPFSRTRDNNGRRLELIDPARPWGWRVINHEKYREKARLSAKNAREVGSGENSQRMSDRRRPPEATTDRLSEATASATEESGRSQTRATRLPADFSLTPERRAVAEAEKQPADRTFAKFCDYWRAASGAKARKHDWDATWRNWCRSEADRSRAQPIRAKCAPPVDEREKQRAQILDLADIFGIEQGVDDWETFAQKVRECNERRLRAIS